MGIKLKAGGGVLLGAGGAPAVDCDCAGCGVYACQACGSCCFHIYTASGVCPGSSVKIRLTYTLYPDDTYGGYRGDCICLHGPLTEVVEAPINRVTAAPSSEWIWALNCYIDNWDCSGVTYTRLLTVKYSCPNNTWEVGIRHGELSTYGCAGLCDSPGADLSNSNGDWEFAGLSGNCLGGTWTGLSNTSAGSACGGTGDVQIQVLQNACCRCSGGNCTKTSDYENSTSSPCAASQDDNCPP